MEHSELTIELSAATVKSLLLCAAKDDIRYYLNGICLDLSTTGRVFFVSTDGHRMLVNNASMADVVGDAPFRDLLEPRFIIPRALLESVKPRKSKILAGYTLTVIRTADRPDPDRAGVTIQGRVSFKLEGETVGLADPIDGEYPDWRKILPNALSNELAQFDAGYLGDFGTIAALLAGDKKKAFFATIGHNGKGPALIGLPGENFGILMPTRLDAPDSLPAWLSALDETETAQAA